MRKLLNTLFVTSEDKYLALENNNVVVYCKETKVAQYPLLSLESIVSFSYSGASPALMGACAKSGISLVFMTPNGRFLARTCGMEHGNVLVRRKQYRIADNETESIKVARNFIAGKVFNQRWVLERATRDHAMRIDTNTIKKISSRLASRLSDIVTASSLDSLRGYEGDASADYFSVFNELILSQKVDFVFDGRNRRPPKDNVNATLSFVYTLLSNDCTSALESVGLDAYVGFMHTDKSGRASLALDLMEELRAPIADRLVLTQINNRKIHDSDFDHKDDGSVYLNDEGRKKILQAWQTHKREEITHPYLHEKIPWGLVPYAQSLLLSRYIRNDIDGYPSFFWK